MLEGCPRPVCSGAWVQAGGEASCGPTTDGASRAEVPSTLHDAKQLVHYVPKSGTSRARFAANYVPNLAR
jgi:hypothetical protein